MKVLVRSNTVMVVTDLTEEDFNRYSKYGAYELYDQEDNQVYAVRKSNEGRINTFGIGCNTVYQGKLAASFVIDGDVIAFLDDSKLALVNLRNLTKDIEENVERFATDFAGIEEHVVIED